MMSHSLEFGHSWQIPSFIDDMIAGGILEDHSWHNDEAPQFVIKSSIRNIKDNDIGNIECGGNDLDQQYLRIWIDHIDPELRDRPENPRWGIESVTGYAAEYQSSIVYGDDVNMLESFILNYHKENTGG